MELLSGASSVLAVVSLAMQLGDKIKTLCDFLNQVKDAPKDIQSILKELCIISNVADTIRTQSESPTPHPRTLETCLQALKQCEDFIEEFEILLAKHEPGFTSPSLAIRKWSALKVTWKSNSIQRFRERLKDTVIILTLARQEFLSRTTAIFHENHERSLVTCNQGLVNQQETSQRSLTSIEDKLDRLLVVRDTTKTIGLDVKDHLIAVREKVKCATDAISNPVLRHALDREIQSALSKLETGLLPNNLEDFDCASASHPNFRRSTLTPMSSGKSKKKSHERLLRSSSTRSPLGRLYLTTVASCHVPLDEDGTWSAQPEIQTCLLFHPSRWLQSCGIDSGCSIVFSMAMSSWDLGLRIKTHRAVPDGAAIFKFCKQGDIAGIQHLFDQGLASPWDRDSKGFTPLFTAARYAKADTCKLLIGLDADMNARTWAGIALPSWACMKVHSDEPEARCVDRINTIRLFVDAFEIWNDPNSCGLLGLRRLMGCPCSHENCAHPHSYPAAFEWILPQVKANIDVEVPQIGQTVSHLILTAMGYQNTKPLKDVLSVVGTLDHVNITRWFSPAHFIASRVKHPEYRASAELLIGRGLDLHMIADQRYNRHPEYTAIRNQTPTMIAMRYSSSFFQYRELLRVCHIDITQFVCVEIARSPMKDRGWNKNSLQALFDLEFEPRAISQISCEDDYHRTHISHDDIWEFGREEWWEKLLLQISKADAEHLTKLSKDLAEDIAANSSFCYPCQIRRRTEGRSFFEEEEGSPFVFPTNFF